MGSIAVLDDWQGRDREFADWDRLDDPVTFVRERLVGNELLEVIRDAEVIVVTRERTPLGKAVIDQLDACRLIVTTGANNASIDMTAARARGIDVCGTTGTGTSTTELTWALILAAVKHIPSEDKAMREGQWQNRLAGDLEQKRLGLVGLGRLGAAMLPVATALSMEVVAWSQNLTAAYAAEVGATFVTKEELFATSDIVSIHLRLSDRTRALVGAAELGAMKLGALLVNTSRGPIVDEAALLDALRAGRIEAALDVYDVEPLPAGHPLTTLPNVVLAPHLGYASEANFAVAFADVVEDIAAWRAGAPIRVLNG